MKSFNLVDEPWITTNRGVLSLRALFQESGTISLQESAIDRFCLLRFLIAVCQAACPLETEEEWDELDDDGLKAAVLQYLEKKKELFDLYDPERPFLQYPGIRSLKEEKALPVAAYVPGTSSGNTTVVFENNCQRKMDDAAKAKLILQQCIMPFSGKKIDPAIIVMPGFQKGKSAPVSPALGQRGLLHTFALGKTFFETLRLAMMTDELLEEVAYVDEIGVAPWEQMPQEDDAVARRLVRSVYGRLIPMTRFCRIDGERLHSTSGVTMPPVMTGHVDFTATVGTAMDPKKQTYKVLPARVQMQPWRQLEAILNFCVPKPDWQCLGVRIANARSKSPVGLWCFGLQVTFQTGEQFFGGRDDVIDSEIRFSASFKLDLFYPRYLTEMSLLEKVSKRLWGSTNAFFKACGAGDDAKDRASRAQDQFWSVFGRKATELIHACEVDDAENLHVSICRTALDIYDQNCPHRTSRQMLAWSHCRPSFADIYKRS